MHVNFESITISKFKSVAQTTTVQLNRDCGLHFIIGNNQVNTALGANAVGKSTLLDAIVWALFGKTLRGLKAKEICTWGEEGGTEVALYISVDGHEYEIKRGWRPNKLHINGAAKEQHEVEDLIGFNFNEASHLLGVGQWSDVFLDLKPTAKLNLLSEVLRLDLWERFGSRASELAKEVTQQYHECNKYVLRLQSQAEQLVSSAKENEARVEQYEQERQEQIEQVKQQIQEFEEIIENARSNANHYSKRAEEYGEGLNELEQRISSMDEVIRKKEKEKNNYELEVRDLDRQLSQLEKQAKSVEKMEGSTCPTCKQDVDPEHVKQYVDELDEQYNQLADQAESYEKEMEKITEQIKEHKESVQQLKEQHHNQEQQYNEFRKYAESNERRANTYTDKIENAKLEIEKLQTKENPYQNLAQSEYADAEQKQAEAEREQQRLNELEKQIEAYQYWSAHAKEIRLFVIEKAITDLELEVNNALAQLGLSDWHITFDVERETQSGSVSRGFTTFIQSPGTDRLVPWESWSGGETQRLRLAGAMGLSSLIENRSGVRLNLEFFDEPTRGLGGEGIHDLLQLLQQRSGNLRKNIYVIDHQSHDFSGFSSVINVIKDQEGTHFVEA